VNTLAITRDQLIYSNAMARAFNWPRHFKEHEFEDVKKYDRDQEWPILFSIRLRVDCWRILFQHDNNELYQLDIPISVYEKLKVVLREEVKDSVH
tara:strand:+ start:271 stop:555 length:285 start_codon:yes stop_codon:yes gene_type:complete